MNKFEIAGDHLSSFVSTSSKCASNTIYFEEEIEFKITVYITRVHKAMMYKYAQ